MKVLIVEPLKKPYAKKITNSLSSMQEIVGGLIQAIYPFEDDPEIALICNDEGKLLGLPLNRALRDEDGSIYDVVSGTFFLCSAPSNRYNFAGLSDEQTARYMKKYEKIEIYIRRK